MEDKKDNANSFPTIYYGLHMVPGVAQYNDTGNDPYRILLDEEVTKKMDPSFAGKPVYVHHVDEVDLKNIQNEADGYVSESFYNPADGKHWVKFLVISDEAKNAIKQGWKLSNSYLCKSFGEGGTWHAVEYLKKVLNAEYEHLAIVPDPRYEESIILTPEQFKQYNSEKETELKRLSNSQDKPKGDSKMTIELYKRAKVENSLDIENTFVELPKSKKEMSIAQLVSEHDKFVNMAGYADPSHMVKVGNDEMSVKDLIKKHQDAMSELESMKKKDDESSDMDEKKNDPDESDTVSEGQKDVGDRGGDVHMNDEEEESEEVVEKKKNAKAAADALKKAEIAFLKNNISEIPMSIETGAEKVARGKARYGSKK